MKTVDLNSKEKPVSIAILCCILSFFAYSSNYTGRSTLSTLAAELNNVNILSTQLFGIACSLFSIVYAVGRFFSGYCGDLIPAKLLISIGVLASGVCNLAIGLIMKPYAIVALWVVNAVAQSIVYGSLLVVAAAVCTEKNKTRYMVVIGITTSFGQVVGFILIPFLVRLGGLRAGFIVPGLLAIAVALIVIFFFPIVPAKGTLSSLNVKVIADDIKFFLSNKEYRAVLFPCLANGIIKDGITVWLASFIMTTYGINLSALAFFAVFVPLINFIGHFLFPSLYKMVHEKESVLGLLCYLFIAITLLPLCFGVKSPVLAIICLSLGSMFVAIANMAFVGMWPLRFSSSNKVSLAAGMIDTPIYIGSGISSAFFGFMVAGWGFKSIFIAMVICSVICVIPLALSQKAIND